MKPRTLLYNSLIFLSLLLLQGCVRPNPVDMRLTLTVSVPEFLPTPTGFSTLIGRATPFPGSEQINAGTPLAPSELSGGSVYYAVILVSEGNFLNVRSGPGIDQPILETLPPSTRDLKLTGDEEIIGEERWVEILRPTGETGWVSGFFLTQQVVKDAFCTYPKVRTLIQKLAAAVQDENPESFADLINPERVLTIRHEWWNPEVNINQAEIAKLQSDSEVRNWGTEAGSGDLIEGSFRKVIWEKMVDVFTGEYSVACNTLEFGQGSGITAGETIWPAEYTNLNYMVAYRPGPKGDELNWRSWALGIEILDGEPYLTYLVQYHWEE
jgi:hypothetical protein